MKNIDIKSLIIGALFTSTVLLGVAATGPKDAWDANQEWEVGFAQPLNGQIPGKKWAIIAEGAKSAIAYAEWPKGWEPVGKFPEGKGWEVRKRIK
jgi:hypothetical protein